MLTRIHMPVAQTSQIQWLPATLHNTGRKDDFEVHYGSIEAITLLHPVDVKEAYTYNVLRYHSVQ